MASDSSISVASRFSRCRRVEFPMVIFNLINAFKNSSQSHIYVNVRSESGEFSMEILPDTDSIEYDDTSDKIEFTSDKGEMLSMISFRAAEIFYDVDRFEGGDEIYEFYHLVYPSGVIITFEILTLHN